MNNDKKVKRERFTTPAGIAVYPRVNTPDTKFNADGRYSVKLRLIDAEAAPIIARLEAAAKAEYDKQVEENKGKLDKKGNPIEIIGPVTGYEVEMDDQKKPTGNTLIPFGMSAIYKNKKTGQVTKLSPRLYDAKGSPTNVEVWGGSKIKVAYEINQYFIAGTRNAGASCRLAAVQIIDLVTRGSAAPAGMYGFKEEAGFSGTAVESDQEAETSVVEGPANAVASSSGDF